MDFAYGTEKNLKPAMLSHGAKTVSEGHTMKHTMKPTWPLMIKGELN